MIGPLDGPSHRAATCTSLPLSTFNAQTSCNLLPCLIRFPTPQVIGFDIGSEPERRFAAQRSAAARSPQSSGIIRLLPDVDQGIDTAGGVTCAAVFPWYSDEEKYGTGDADSDLSIPPEATVCAAFNWRVLMGGVLPESAKGFVFMVTAQREQLNATSYTFRVAGASVEDVAPARMYDTSLGERR